MATTVKKYKTIRDVRIGGKHVEAGEVIEIDHGNPVHAKLHGDLNNAIEEVTEQAPAAPAAK